MQRIQDPTAVSTIPPVPTLTGPVGYFTGGNPSGGIPATRVRAWWLNMLMQELVGIVEAAGITPSAAGDQVLTACRAMFGGTGRLDGNGYMRLPGGVILQWGLAVSTGANTGVVFPTGFPTRSTSIVITEQNAVGWETTPKPTIYGASSQDRFGFQCRSVRISASGIPSYESGLGFNWMAIGY
ncbi:hypothetical protein HMPREF9946_00101 [Acetobacteraceae bacterium AT-5844]|nr:hypothetical protein HMPREF9946_00101 [Acetobacteraceae bacterium AT-5844]